MMAITSNEIFFGQTPVHSPMLVQLPKNSVFARAIIFSARLSCSGLPWGRMPRWVILAPVKRRGGGVGAGGDAGTAADTGGGIHGAVGHVFAHEDGVAVGRVAGGDGDVASGFDDAVEGAAVQHQVFDRRKRPGPPRLKRKLLAIFEVPHGELADGGGALRAVRLDW